MHISYNNKKSEKYIFENSPKASFNIISGKGSKNKLIHSDNLSALNSLINNYRGKIDLIYIDPPFSTNINFKFNDERSNTISSNKKGKIAYKDTLTGDQFFEFLRERLIFMRELLSKKGSIYLHIDYKIGHYIKLIMDEVFGKENFRNDITRIKCNPKNFGRRAYGNIKDMILFYSRTNTPIWNDPRTPFTDEDKKRLFKKIDLNGRWYTTIPLHAPGETVNGTTGRAWNGSLPPSGRHWRTDPSILDEWDKAGLIEWSSNKVPRKKIYLDELIGKKVQDIWDFKDPQYPNYPTEKNFELLKFIINASSNPDSIILDCFAGSGTTLVAAEMLNRAWIGIDMSNRAIEVIKKRLRDIPNSLFSKVEYEFIKAK